MYRAKEDRLPATGIQVRLEKDGVTYELEVPLRTTSAYLHIRQVQRGEDEILFTSWRWAPKGH